MMTTWFASVIVPSLGDQVRPSQVVQYLARRVRARRRHHAATGMRARAAHVEAPGRSAVLREAGERAVEQHLVEGEISLEDISLGETCLVLDHVRRARFDVPDQRFEVRAVAGDL